MFSSLTSDLNLTAVVTFVSLVAVWVPFYRGIRVGLQALAATRIVEGAELRAADRRETASRVTPLALVFARVLRSALRDGAGSGHPREFLVDASKQYALHEYETLYATRMTMYASILPPIGFIGTTGGLLILFLSMHLSNASLELGALAVALTSSIFALIAYALLEGMKIQLYGRLLCCLDGVISLQRAAEQDRADAPARGVATAG